MTGPRLFQRYLAPYYREFAAYLHRHGKLLATHLDGEPSTLLDVIKDSGLDVIEAFTPRPMTRATVGDAQKVWGDAIVIWGGVASTVLCPETTSDEEFQSSVEEALGAARRGHAFILGVGDNIMPEASLDRVRRIRELLED
jgi:uroporphyrinogen-III decarboxylase